MLMLPTGYRKVTHDELDAETGQYGEEERTGTERGERYAASKMLPRCSRSLLVALLVLLLVLLLTSILALTIVRSTLTALQINTVVEPQFTVHNLTELVINPPANTVSGQYAIGFISIRPQLYFYSRVILIARELLRRHGSFDVMVMLDQATEADVCELVALNLCTLARQASNATSCHVAPFDGTVNLNSSADLSDTCGCPLYLLGLPPNLHFLHVDESTCRARNYTGLDTFKNEGPTAREQMVYAWAVLYTNSSFHWLVEDDVFVPSVTALLALQHRSLGMTPDAAVVSRPLEKWCLNEPGSSNSNDWHWPHILSTTPKHLPPRVNMTGSMVNVIGLSRTFLQLADDYVRQKGRFFLEAFFTTMAVYWQLPLVQAGQLDSLLWLHDWSEWSFEQRPRSLYHPLKNQTEQLRLFKRFSAEEETVAQSRG